MHSAGVVRRGCTCAAGRLQRLRSLEVLQGFCSGERGSGFTLPASLSQLTALTRLAVSTDYLGAGLLQLTSLRSLMLHRLQVSVHSSRTLHTLFGHGMTHC